jgi:DNA polymerase-3 subunit delta
MTPAQLSSRLKRGQIAPAYLLLGAEVHQRDFCRQELIGALLRTEGMAEGVTRHDLNQAALTEVIDDARCLSLFVQNRVLVVENAEAALPRQKGGEEAAEEDSAAGTELLVQYPRDPSPGVVLLFEATRFDLEGEGKKKADRVRKFYAAVADVVELKRYSIEEALGEAQKLAVRKSVDIDGEALALMVESLAGDVARIAVEMEKLALYGAGRQRLTVEDVANLAPDARSATIFALVAAMGRRDRGRALEILDALTREGEYLPLALSFLATQLRMALVAREAGLRSPQQVQSYFSKLGVPMWGSRADQVTQTATRFSKAQLETGLRLTFLADRDLRSTRPDDRIVMERFILGLTA